MPRKIIFTKEQTDSVVELYCGQFKSTTDIAKEIGWPICRVRHLLLLQGKLRSIKEGIRLASPKMSATHTGMKRPPRTEVQKQHYRESALRRGVNAVGVSMKPSGYYEFTRGPHKGRSVHAVVAERKIGRKLLPFECVHHIDENKLNNHPSNLMVMTKSDHMRHHRLNYIKRMKKVSNGQL